MPLLSKAMKTSLKSVPKASKFAADYGIKTAKDYANRAKSTTKDVASQLSDTASDYGQQASQKAKDTFSTNNKKKSKKKKSSPLVGIGLTKAIFMIVGSAVAVLLFTPQSGKETRKDLKNFGKRMKDKEVKGAKEMLGDAKEAYSEVKAKKEGEQLAVERADTTTYPQIPEDTTAAPSDTSILSEESRPAGERLETDAAYGPAENLASPVREEDEGVSSTAPSQKRIVPDSTEK